MMAKSKYNDKLTPREFEILSVFAYGASTLQQVADKIGIERRTVQTHLHNIYEKLNVTKLHCAILKVFPPSQIDYSLIDKEKTFKNYHNVTIIKEKR